MTWLEENASEYTVNGKTYRNLEAQVLKNKDDIEDLQDSMQKTIVAGTGLTKTEGTTSDTLAVDTSVIATMDDLLNEVEDREEADTALQTAINSEASTRQLADNALASSIATKSTVSASSTGSSTDEVQYLTIDGTEYKISVGSSGDCVYYTAKFSSSSSTSFTLENSVRWMNIYDAHINNGKQVFLCIYRSTTRNITLQLVECTSSKMTFIAPGINSQYVNQINICIISNPLTSSSTTGTLYTYSFDKITGDDDGTYWTYLTIGGTRLALKSGSVVTGTNDGTNWLTLTVDGTTYAIPSGGSGTVELDTIITYSRAEALAAFIAGTRIHYLYNSTTHYILVPYTGLVSGNLTWYDPTHSRSAVCDTSGTWSYT